MAAAVEYNEKKLRRAPEIMHLALVLFVGGDDDDECVSAAAIQPKPTPMHKHTLCLMYQQLAEFFSPKLK
jgi:hypothetical protein